MTAESTDEVLVVDALGTSMAVATVGLTVAERHRLAATWARAGARWAAADTVPAGSVPVRAAVLGPEGAPATGHCAGTDAESTVLAGDFAELCERLTITLTHVATTRRRTDHVLLHAAGLVAADGSTVALIGPSGRGKTTATTVLGRALGYLSDETVAVADDRTVLPYPKPLSIKSAAGGPKHQATPDELGLLPLPDARPVLRTLVVLDRRPGTVLPVLERVSLTEVLPDLIGQVGHLGARDRPLQRLRALVDACGGVRRITYGEAGTLDGPIAELLADRGPVAPTPYSDGGTAHPAVTDTDGWRHDETVVDWVADEDRVLVLAHGRVTVLDGIGGVVWRSTAAGATTDDVVDAVVRAFGPPPVGDAELLVTAAVDELVSVGLLCGSDVTTATSR